MAYGNCYHIDCLPDEILLQVFKHLIALNPESDEKWFVKRLVHRNNDRDSQPHAGLRAYPFLGQVCRKWDQLLTTPIAKSLLWPQIVVDFGHELVTAIHTPLIWSNERPNPDEYRSAFNETSLSPSKVIDFVLDKQTSIRSLTMCNSEGFWGDEGEYYSLTGKHSFQSSHMGFLLGQLRNQLQEIRLYNCNDLLSTDQGFWSLVAMCPNMRTLTIEGINFRVASQRIAALSSLRKLESLSLIGEENTGQWVFGLESLPQTWSQLQSLKSLELRGHPLLDSIPIWLKQLPSLRLLDVSANANINLLNVTMLTQLEVLVMQNLDLSQPMGNDQISAAAKRILPNLETLPRLKSLSLANNHFTRLPECLVKLTALETLDFNGNKELQILAPLTAMITAMPNICVLDFRGVHKEKGTAYWSDAKCTTMKFLAAMAKVLKRRKYASRVVMDSD